MRVFKLRSDGVAFSDLGGEIVILDLDTSTYFSVRETGALLVTALMDGACVDALVDQVVEAYDVTPDIAQADVTAFLAELEARNLLQQPAA